MTESHSQKGGAETEGTKERFGTRMKNKFKAQKLRTKVIASLSTLGVLAMATFAVTPTVANWNSSEVAGSNLQTGSFGLQINTGNGWSSTGNAELSFDDFAYWAPNDEQTQNFRLRMDPNSSHTGVIYIDDCGTSSGNSVQVSSSGQADGYIWRMQSPNMDDRIEGGRLDTCTHVDMFGGDGRIVLHPDNTSGEQFGLTINSNSNLNQAQDTTFNLRFRADQLPHHLAP